VAWVQAEYQTLAADWIVRDRYYVKNYNAGAGLSDCGNRRTVAIVRPDSLKRVMVRNPKAPVATRAADGTF
jgi:hypothetical protein